MPMPMPPLGAENSCKRGQRTNLFGLCQVQPNLEKLKKSSFDDFSGDKTMRNLRSRLVRAIAEVGHLATIATE